MNKFNKVIGIGLGICGITGMTSAFAGVANDVGTWQGNGAVFSVEGKQLSTYTVEMINTAVNEHEVSSQIIVNLPDGTQKIFSQIMQDTSKGFSLVSDFGKGGGYCLGEGLCLAYVGAGDGKNDSAMTIVIDSPTVERIVRTELKDGNAIQIFREKYLKTN